MGTTADKLNKILESKAAIKAAIEEKGVTGVGDVLSAYPDKIRSIQAGGSANLQNKSVEFNDDYTFTVTPDDGYNGLGEVTVKVNTPKVKMFDTLFKLPDDFPDIYKIASDPRYVRPEYPGRVIVCGGSDLFDGYGFCYKQLRMVVEGAAAVQTCDGQFVPNPTTSTPIDVGAKWNTEGKGPWAIFYFGEGHTSGVDIGSFCNEHTYLIADGVELTVDVMTHYAIPAIDYMNGGCIGSLILAKDDSSLTQIYSGTKYPFFHFRFSDMALVQGVVAMYGAKTPAILVIENFPLNKDPLQYLFNGMAIATLQPIQYCYIDVCGNTYVPLPLKPDPSKLTKLRYGRLPCKVGSINLTQFGAIGKDSVISLGLALPVSISANTVQILSSVYGTMTAEEKAIFSTKGYTLASI